MSVGKAEKNKHREGPSEHAVRTQVNEIRSAQPHETLKNNFEILST